MLFLSKREDKKLSYGSYLNYLKIARIDRWYKCLFVLAGAVIASLLCDPDINFSYWPVALGMASASLVAFSNYVINEWFDKDFDRFHPVKRKRTLIQKRLNPLFVCIEYFVLLGAGLSMASFISASFFCMSVILAISGIIYNIKPFRVKDVFFLDVLFDSISSPIRFVLGWIIIADRIMPPMTFLLCFWSAGAYFMVRKRYLEYQLFGQSRAIELYRKSFAKYSAKLLQGISVFFMVCFFMFFTLVVYQVVVCS